MRTEPQPWPTEIRVRRAERALEIDFDDGRRLRFPAELLRIESPSAEVQGHGPGQKQLVVGKRDVGIIELEPVGNYAVRIKFDDLHDTGIFSWSYFLELSRDQDRVWNNYLQAIEAKGLSRDP